MSGEGQACTLQGVERCRQRTGLLYNTSRWHHVLQISQISVGVNTMEEEDIVDCHDGDGLTDSGTERCDDGECEECIVAGGG
jgi:hypothetical protein